MELSMRYRMYVAALMLMLCAELLGQYKPMQVGKGAPIPGETLINVIVGEYAERGVSFSQALKNVSQRFGLRVGIRVNVTTEFRDPLININLKNASLREVINQIVRASGFVQSEWYIDGSDADAINIELGRITGADLLATRIRNWSAPEGYSPDEVLANLLIYLPELRQKVYGSSGVAGNRMPVQQGCVLIYSSEGQTVSAIIRDLAKIANRSWMFVFVQNDLKKCRMLLL